MRCAVVLLFVVCVAAVPIENVPEVSEPAPVTMVQATSSSPANEAPPPAPPAATRLRVKTGTVSIGSNAVTISAAGMTHPVLFMAPIFETDHSHDVRAVVPRITYSAEANEFTVTIISSPCVSRNNMPSGDVDYLILSAKSDGLYLLGDLEHDRRVAVFSESVAPGVESVDFPGLFKRVGNNNPMCLGQVQSTNQAGFLQVNTNPYGDCRSSASVNLSGYEGLVSMDRNGYQIAVDPTIKEDVALLCFMREDGDFSIPASFVGADGTTTTDGSLYVGVRESLAGIGLLNVDASSRSGFLLGGQLAEGETPYQFRAYPDSNGLRSFFVQRDVCSTHEPAPPAQTALLVSW